MRKRPEKDSSKGAGEQTRLNHRTSMDFAGDRYYSLNRVLLCSIGLWPYQDAKMTRIQRVISTVILVSSIVVQVNHFCARLNGNQISVISIKTANFASVE